MARLANPPRPWRGGEALRNARTCYDHLAGRLGVALAEALERGGYVRAGAGEITPAGMRFFAEHGLDLEPGKRVPCRACLDWSERQPHIAGALGARLAAHALAEAWVRRIPGSRALRMTDAGRAGFAREFGVRVPD